jgi:hypothetical protein
MKLLLAFKSFLPRRLIVEIDSENWFAAGCPIWQRELFRCRQRKTVSLLAPQFRQRITISLQPTQLRQQIVNAL